VVSFYVSYTIHRSFDGLHVHPVLWLSREFVKELIEPPDGVAAYLKSGVHCDLSSSTHESPLGRRVKAGYLNG
jgi:hypothetical protein